MARRGGGDGTTQNGVTPPAGTRQMVRSRPKPLEFATAFFEIVQVPTPAARPPKPEAMRHPKCI